MRRVLLVTFAAACVASSPVHPHAFLDHAAPSVGSTVRAAPAHVKLWFTQELESAFSTVRVVDRSYQRVDRGDAKVDPADARIVQVSVPVLAPGRYRVVWRVLSVDTHVTEGDFTFDVAP